ncbi:MAG: GNAT family N-acetyltransferase, partial [Candidatus Omnitrophica bacterium]|nr:GNAT family N-acetyltransferase [Candidatus Omnitrophota bacterium]
MNRERAHEFRTNEWTREEWIDLSNQFPSMNIYQRWDYAELHSGGKNRSVIRAGLFDGQIPLALAQMRVKKLPILGVGVAELEWGPLYRGTEELKAFLGALKNEVNNRLGYELRVHPKSTYHDEGDAFVRGALEDLDFEWDSGERPYQTVILDLGPDLEDLYGNLHGSWRRQHRKAERSGLVLVSGSAVEFFDRFSGVYDQMWQSKQFITGVRHPIIREMVEKSSEKETFHISIASLGERDVGASISVQCGDSLLYFLGASAPDLSDDCQPGYLLHWNNVTHAKQAGLAWYDLGGIVDTGEGVNRFKRGMGARDVVFPGCFVAGGKKMTSKIYHAVKDSYRGLR